jgi:putative SOS response-associated peptidase YedK
MCYSAQIRAGYEKYVRAYGADISIREFVQLYWERGQGAKLKTPKAMDAAFASLEGPEGQKIRDLVAAHNAEQATKLEQELFKQRKRLADAERTLLTKTTKAATESKRIATDKVAWALGKLADIRRTDLVPEDSRIFPSWYAPVMVMENGKRVIKPMRYQCRPAGTPANYDFKFPGTYNARRDNLEGGYWQRLFGYSHGVMIVNAFFENVARHAMEHRELAPGEKEENVVLEFRPRPQHDMLVACLWSHWKGRADEPELLSFAAITDEPPPEVAAAGHDRCIVPIKPENLDAWLNPDPADLARQYAILADRDRPYYEHRLAA